MNLSIGKPQILLPKDEIKQRGECVESKPAFKKEKFIK